MHTTAGHDLHHHPHLAAMGRRLAAVWHRHHGGPDFEQLRAAFPPPHCHRHELERPALEQAAAARAAEHPEAVSPGEADGEPLPPCDVEQLELALAEVSFRRLHGLPQEWAAGDWAAYAAMRGEVHRRVWGAP